VEPSDAAYADGERDALAILSRILAGDDEGGQAIANNMVPPAVMTALVNLLFGELDAHGTDKAGWVARKQAELGSGTG
jgi:hypothetical protein